MKTLYKTYAEFFGVNCALALALYSGDDITIKDLKEDAMDCPKCSRMMESMGPVNNIVLTTNPPQYDVQFVCHYCKIKKVSRISSVIDKKADVDDYTEFLEK